MAPDVVECALLSRLHRMHSKESTLARLGLDGCQRPSIMNIWEFKSQDFRGDVRSKAPLRLGCDTAHFDLLLAPRIPLDDPDLHSHPGHNATSLVAAHVDPALRV